LMSSYCLVDVDERNMDQPQIVDGLVIDGPPVIEIITQKICDCDEVKYPAEPMEELLNLSLEPLASSDAVGTDAAGHRPDGSSLQNTSSAILSHLSCAKPVLDQLLQIANRDPDPTLFDGISSFLRRIATTDSTARATALVAAANGVIVDNLSGSPVSAPETISAQRATTRPGSPMTAESERASTVRPREPLSSPSVSKSIATQEERSSSKESSCVVCYEQPPEVAFAVCGHYVCCVGCACTLVMDVKTSKCPMCRAVLAVDDIVFMYEN